MEHYGLIIFSILFIGFCVGIGWVIWKSEKPDGKKKINAKGTAKPKT